jgi:hypothetical protein
MNTTSTITRRTVAAGSSHGPMMVGMFMRPETSGSMTTGCGSFFR